MRKVPYRLSFFLAALLALGLYGAAVTIPNVFVSGDTIVAAEVNENFQALEQALEATQSELADVQASAPAIASAYTQFVALTQGTGTAIVLAQVDVTLPTDGVVHTQVNGQWRVNDVNGESALFAIFLTDTLDGIPVNLVGAGVASVASTPGNHYFPAAAQRIFRRPAGTHTFYAVGLHQTGASAQATYSEILLTATSYADEQAAGVPEDPEVGLLAPSKR